jgi:hypothetical protein
LKSLLCAEDSGLRFRVAARKKGIFISQYAGSLEVPTFSTQSTVSQLQQIEKSLTPTFSPESRQNIPTSTRRGEHPKPTLFLSADYILGLNNSPIAQPAVGIFAFVTKHDTYTRPSLDERPSEVCSNRLVEALSHGPSYALKIEIRMLFAVKIYVNGAGH